MRTNFRNVVVCGSATLLLAACGGQSTDQDQAHSAVVARSLSTAGSPPDANAQLGTAPTLADMVALDKDKPKAAHARMLDASQGSIGLTIDTQDREAVRTFYNGLFGQSDGVPMGWTGNYATADAGSVSSAYQDATALRINWFRAMAGVPANITLSAQNSAADQQAALMMSVNNQLSHYPPTSWTDYTAVGADAAGHSNLALNQAGPDAVVGYMRDSGSNNAAVGHRRWLFYPETQVMGSGTVPGATVGGKALYPANALWILDSNVNGPRPSTRDDFVAWPPRGYVPYQVVYGRWSLSYPNADFSSASVQVLKNGINIPVTFEPMSQDYGENTLVWHLQGATDSTIWPKPPTDDTYAVSVSNVKVNGVVRSFSYNTVVIDPATAAQGAVQTVVMVPSNIQQNQPFEALITPVSGATGYRISAFRDLGSLNRTLTPSNSASSWTAYTTGSYNALSGSAFHLYHSDPTAQNVTLNTPLFISNGASISFSKTRYWATSAESFRVQVSTDDGTSWADVFSEVGTNASSPAIQTQINLGAFAGQEIRIRFEVDVASGGSYYNQCTPACGWQFSNITLTNVDELTVPEVFDFSSPTSTMKLSYPGNYVVAAKTQFQAKYYSANGPLSTVRSSETTFSGPLSNYSIIKTTSGYTVTDKTGRDGVQTLIAPTRINFTDYSVAFDIDGNAGKAYRLYQAAFARKPDLPGLGFWMAALDNGVSLDSVASGFANSNEFKALYGNSPSNADLVVAMYANVLQRTPDAPGNQFWLDAMNNGLSVQQLLYSFSESDENKIRTAQDVVNGIVYQRQ